MKHRKSTTIFVLTILLFVSVLVNVLLVLVTKAYSQKLKYANSQISYIQPDVYEPDNTYMNNGPVVGPTGTLADMDGIGGNGGVVSTTEEQFIASLQADATTMNVFFLGNSITVHGTCDYWWGEWGMAASDRSRDFVHLAVSDLTEFENVDYSTMNFATWEAMNYDRQEILSMMDQFISDKTDFVVIQLGENVKDSSNLRNDFDDMIDHIHEKAPNAKLLMVGNFWMDDTVEAIKKDVAQARDIFYISLADIADNPSYECGLNTVVYGDDGVNHIIEHDGVALHPGDAGMREIANRVVQSIQLLENRNQ